MARGRGELSLLSVQPLTTQLGIFTSREASPSGGLGAGQFYNAISQFSISLSYNIDILRCVGRARAEVRRPRFAVSYFFYFLYMGFLCKN